MKRARIAPVIVAAAMVATIVAPPLRAQDVQPEHPPARESGPQFEIYGRFCGPGNPAITGATAAERIAKLQAIKPRDSLDAYCKMHDICYQRRHLLSIECDKKLIHRVRALAAVHREAARTADGTLRDEHHYCAVLAGTVADYFQTFQPSYRNGTTIEDLLDWARRVIAVPLSVIRRGANRIGFLFSNRDDDYRCRRAFIEIGYDGQLRSFVADDGLK